MKQQSRERLAIANAPCSVIGWRTASPMSKCWLHWKKQPWSSAMHQQQVLKLVFIPQTNSKCSDETTAKGLLAIASNWQSCLDSWFVVILWLNQWALQDLKTLGLWWHVQILEWKTERLQAVNKLKNIWASFHLVQKECHGPDKQYRYIFQSNACTNSMWILSSLQSFKALL